MVPIDGSSFAREAVLQGLRIATLSGAALRLVRVTAPPLSRDALAGDNGLREGGSAALKDLSSIASECRANSAVSVTTSLESGPVVDALCSYSRRNAVDLIVMRSSARRGLARAWFGSVADALIRESGVPVLVVRPPSVSTAMKRGFSFRRIVAPLDGSLIAEQSLKSVVSMAKIESASILLLFVVSPESSRKQSDMESPIGPASAREVGAAQHYLDSIIARLSKGLSISSKVVISSDVAGAILQAAAEDEADLVAIATHGRGAIARARSGSVSDRVMRDSVVSTLVVHPILELVNQASPVIALKRAII